MIKMSQKYGIKQSLSKLAVKYAPPHVPEPEKPEHICTPCFREKEEIEAVNYCKECNEKLCAACVLQHRKFQILKTHRILGVREAPKKDKPKLDKPVNKLVERCEQHPRKTVGLYCRDHDVVGCDVCIAVSHKQCPEAEYIATISVGLMKTNVVKETREDILKHKKDLFMLKLKRLADKKRLTKERDSILSTILEMRKRLNDILDKLEELAKEKLQLKFGDDMMRIKSDIKQCDDAIASLDEALKGLKAESEAQLFVFLKRDAKNGIIKGEKVLHNVTENIGKETIAFTVDENIEEWMCKLSGLGKFDHEQNVYSGALYAKLEADIESDSDKTDYVFNGCVNLPDGRTILADWKNRRVKLFDTAYRIRGHCDVPGEPYAICGISPSEIAVSLRDEKLVQFVSIEGKMELSKRLKLDEYCRGIGYHSNELFISCGGGDGEIHGQLRVYNMSGNMKRVYEEDIQGKPIFTCPKDIVLNPEGTRIYVVDRKKGVVTLSREGKLLSVFGDSSLRSPTGLCLDGWGNLFVLGNESNNVIQIGADGRKLGEVVTEADGVSNPLSICCHESVSTRLIISMELSNIVKVFSLQAK